MELLLVAGTSNDIFIYNYAKWLKKTMDCRIDVFEFSPSAFQGYDSEFYDHVQTARSIRFPVAKIRRTLNVFVNARSLKHYLQGRHYDVIHVQRVLPPFVLQKGLKDHCSKLVMTFWGGEFSKETILFSSRLYRHYLERISKEVDCIINSSSNKESILKQLPAFKGSFKAAMLGSAPLEALYSLMETESKDESKRRLGMPEDKLWPIDKPTWNYLDGNGFHLMTTLYDDMVRCYGEPSGIEDYARKGQLVGAMNSKSIWEVWNYNRLDDGDRFCSGLLFWYHNCPNVQVCARMWDYYLEPTASLYHTMHSLEPLHIQFDYLKNTVSIINDCPEPVHALRLKATLHDLSSKLVKSWDIRRYI